MVQSIFNRVFSRHATTESTAPETSTGAEISVTSLKEAFAEKYPDGDNILGMFEEANNCPATWENLSKVRLQRFIDHMSGRLAPNSVHQYAARLKVVLNLYAEEVILPSGYEKVLSPKKCATTAVYLNEDELDRLITYNPKNDRERYVRNLFVISAYTGARHSDAENLNESNIIGDILQYVSVKTKTPTTIPLKPAIVEYIKNTPEVTVSPNGYNDIIRRIARKCGITQKTKIFHAGKEEEGEKWQFIGSHTARRSFASNLYLRGVDIYTISKLLGHSDVKMTQGYIRAGVRTDSDALRGYFQ